MSTNVYMYTTVYCPFCVRARHILNNKNIEFTDIAVDDANGELRREMEVKSGRRTVPQIWMNGEHIGGCNELMQMEFSGELDTMLTSEAPLVL